MKTRPTLFFFALALISPAPVLAADAHALPPYEVRAIQPPLKTEQKVFTGTEEEVEQDIGEWLLACKKITDVRIARTENKLSDRVTLMTVTITYRIADPEQI